jgi:hypothetical protein
MWSHLVSCDGLGRFDGTAWRRFLTDRCVQEIDVDVDGNAWVRAASTSDGRRRIGRRVTPSRRLDCIRQGGDD